MSFAAAAVGVDEGVVEDEGEALFFGQELGHAWGSFVYFDQGAGAETALLGRDAR